MTCSPQMVLRCHCKRPESLVRFQAKLNSVDGASAGCPMFMSMVVLVVSAGLFFFYFQATCERILRRKFAHSYFLSVVKATRLEFLSISQKTSESAGASDYGHLRTGLKCDYIALAYLLKHGKKSIGREERLLMVYFRVMLFFLALRHVLRLSQKPAILKLSAILQYFSNVVGQRMCDSGWSNMAATEFVSNL
jgi:hypothetical protein